MKTFFRSASEGMAILFPLLLVINSCDISGSSSYKPNPNFNRNVKVYLPEKCNGQILYIWLLEEYKITDEGIQAEIAARFSTTCSNDTIFYQSFNPGTEGRYYLCALVTNNHNFYTNKFPILIPESGEYFGFYDSGFLPPDKPNVYVRLGGDDNWDLYLKKFP